MTSGTAEVHKTATGEDDDTMAIGEDEAVNLLLDRLDNDTGVAFEASHVDLVVEMTNVGHNGVVLHLGHVAGHDDAEVAGASHVDISSRKDRLQSLNLEALHARLECTDGVDLSDDNTSTTCLHGGSTSLADITVAADNNLLAGNHDIGGTHEAIGERVTAAINVVELGLGHAVIDVDSFNEKLTAQRHLFQSVDTSGRLLADTVESSDHLAPLLGVAGLKLTAEDAKHLLHLEVIGGSGIGECSEFLELLLGLHTFVHEESGITTIIDEDIRAIGIGPCEHLQGALPVLLKVLTLPGENVGSLGGNDTSSGVVLCRVDVAGSPAHLSTKRVERLNEDTSLNGHVQRARDAGASKNVIVLVLLTESHETGHLNLGEVVLAAAKIGEGHVLDLGLEAFGVHAVVRVNHLIFDLLLSASIIFNDKSKADLERKSSVSKYYSYPHADAIVQEIREISN